MAFKSAAELAHSYSSLDLSPTLQSLIYNGQEPWKPDYQGIQAYHIPGQALDNRFIGYKGKSVDFGEVVNSQFGPVEKHSMSTMVMGVFAEGLRDQSWKIASPYFWSALYDDNFAEKIGAVKEGQLKEDGKYSDILRAMIAYSALEKGAMPFGNTAIRAMFDDANDLGKALGTNINTNLSASATRISEVFVQYAGILAINEKQGITSSLTKGVLHASADGSSLVVRLDDAVWRAANESVPKIVPEKSLINETVFSGGLLGIFYFAPSFRRGTRNNIDC